jgi:nicotinate-nucleotide--dimethylbenzimidazole phosphoribosyltransferase
MVGNFLAGGAVVNAFAAQVDATVRVVDVGCRRNAHTARRPGRAHGPSPARRTSPARPPWSAAEAVEAIEAGIRTARELVAEGHRILLGGDMGIANTTASAALVCAFTGAEPERAPGRGTGVDDVTYARKVAVVRDAIALHRPDPEDPIGVLAALGGLEHAALAGFLLARRRCACRRAGRCDRLLGRAGRRAPVSGGEGCVGRGAPVRGAGSDAGARRARLAPLVDLGLRLGEGQWRGAGTAAGPGGRPRAARRRDVRRGGRGRQRCVATAPGAP